MITMQSFQQQLKSFDKEEAAQKKLFEAKLKAKKERRKLKKELNDKKKGVGKSGKAGSNPKAESGEYAAVAALALAMQQNMQIAGSKAEQLSGQSGQIDNLNNKLNQLEKDQEKLKDLSPKEALQRSQELNAEVNATNNQTSIIGSDTNEQVMNLKFFSSMNNQLGGGGQNIVNLLMKEGTQSPV